MAKNQNDVEKLGVSSVALASFLNSKHLDERRILKNGFDFDSALPFKHLKLRDFLLLPKAVALKRAVVDLDYELKKSDLFEFFQSIDLTSLHEGVISDFVHLFLSAPFRAYIMAISGVDLSQSEITLFGSRYEDTNYLLPHDDRLEGRQIAFLYYLTDMNEGHGGELVLFGKNEDWERKSMNPDQEGRSKNQDSKHENRDTRSMYVDSRHVMNAGNSNGNSGVVTEKLRIRPRFNSLVFFEVGPESIHAVSEVIGSGERYTLGGWFVVKGTQKVGEYL